MDVVVASDKPEAVAMQQVEAQEGKEAEATGGGREGEDQSAVSTPAIASEAAAPTAETRPDARPLPASEPVATQGAVAMVVDALPPVPPTPPNSKTTSFSSTTTYGSSGSGAPSVVPVMEV